MTLKITTFSIMTLGIKALGIWNGVNFRRSSVIDNSRVTLQLVASITIVTV